MPIKITQQLSQYIKNAAKSNTHQAIANQLGMSRAGITLHLRGKTKCHICVNCGKTIGHGEYCSVPECVTIRDRIRHRKDRSKADGYKPNHNVEPKIEMICDTCGRLFLRGCGEQRREMKEGSINTYCSRECCYNRVKVKHLLESRIKNIEILSGLIDKPKPIERPLSLASEMRKIPESEEHMRKRT